MANSLNAYSTSDKIRQIQGKVNVSNTLNGFLDKNNLSRFLGKNNKDDQNILKILSDILVSLVGSQEKLKQLLVDLLTNNLGTIEVKIKDLLKKYALQLCSCGLDGRLNLPNGVIDQYCPTPCPMPDQYPYIDQYDFYGLFTKNIDDPLQKLQFDENLNSFIKREINSQSPSFTWKNEENVDVVMFTYDEANERIKIGPPTGVDWGVNGIGLKQFTDLYIDSINLFPTGAILKSLLDSIFNMKSGGAYDVDLDFLAKLLDKKCNCKSIEDDRSKSTFDLTYNDFIPETTNEQDGTLMTNIKFGPVDAPIPLTLTPPQPNLDEAYLKSVSVLSKDEFVKGNRADKANKIAKAIDDAAQDQSTQTNSINLPLSKKFSLKPGLEADMNLKMILSLPSILTMPLLSPKISMYFAVIYKRYYVQDPTKELWKTKDEYYAFVAKLIELVIEDLIKYLLEKLFAIIKKEIIKLIKKIIIKILSEKVLGYITQLKSILDLYNMIKGMIPPKLPQINFNNCKSVLDNLLKLFDMPNIPPGSIMPPGMSMMGMMKTGLSSTAMTQDAVSDMDDNGMDTKPMPDGSPNPNVVLASAMSKAVIKQLQTNARVQVSTVGVGYGEGGGTIT
jgi:hypothetical protein